MPGRLQRRLTRRHSAKSLLHHAHWYRSTSIPGSTDLRWFDSAWYLDRYADVAAAGMDPLEHYLSGGMLEGRRPNRWFAPDWYLNAYPDVASSRLEPLMHFALHGLEEGRRPNHWWDERWYIACHQVPPGQPPFLHYVLLTDASILQGFDSNWYLKTYADVRDAGLDPLEHYLSSGFTEARQPIWWFEPGHYLSENGDVAAAGIEPFEHYLTGGRSEGRTANAWFDAAAYIRRYPDVQAAGIDPLQHYVLFGRDERRIPGQIPSTVREIPDIASINPVPEFGELLDWQLTPGRGRHPRITFLLPGFGPGWLTGGPLNAVAVAYELSKHRRVRLLTVHKGSPPTDLQEVAAAVKDSLGLEFAPDLDRSLFDVAEPGDSTCEEGEVFVATAWWTAVEARRASFISGAETPFFYLVQDYEPLLHAASPAAALAVETYTWPSKKMVSSSGLLCFFQANEIGSFADDRDVFVLPCPSLSFAPPRLPVADDERTERGGRRTLLFYARPTKARRNLFELGFAAIARSIELGVFDPAEWSFVSVGELLGDHPLPNGAVLRNAPWLRFPQYLELVSESDVYLAPMHAPHTGFPVLEAAQLGSVGVTTVFDTKDAAFFEALSPRILAAEPTVDSLVRALERAEHLSAIPSSSTDRSLGSYVQEWSTSARQAAAWMMERLPAEFPRTIEEQLDSFAANSLCRTCNGTASVDSSKTKFTMAMAVYDTPLNLLERCLATISDIRVPVTAELEIVVVDNGSTADVGAIAKVVRRMLPQARFSRLDDNRGIVSGMKALLQMADGEYFIPVDSDDLLAPSCLEYLTRHVHAESHPDFMYSDEFVFDSTGHVQPFLKGAYDPVLSSEICQTAHLNCFNVEVARSLGVYQEGWPEGSHDWATSAAFWAAGRTVVHIPHVLYGWRAHEGSTSMDWRGKPYVLDSQRDAMRKMAGGFGQKQPMFEHHPGFPDGPNQRLESAADLAGLSAGLIHITLGDRSPDALGLSRLPADLLPRLLKENAAALASPLVWFSTCTGVIAPQATREIASLLYTYGAGNVFTGETAIPGKIVARPVKLSEEHSNWHLPGNIYALISRVCRQSVAEINPFNVVVPLEDVIQTLHETEPQSLEHLAVLAAWRASDRGGRQIFSPQLLCHGEYPLMPGMLDLVRDLYPRREAAVLAEVSTADGRESAQHSEIVALSPTKNSAAPSIALLTTLRGALPAHLLASLFKSIEGQLEAGCHWHILVHGKASAKLLRLIDEINHNKYASAVTTAEDLSLTEALNAALARSREDFVMCVDSDDLLIPGAVAHIRQSLALYEDIDAVIGDELVGESVQSSRYFRRPSLNVVGPREFSQYFHPIAVRRSLLLKSGFPDPSSEFFHDWFMMDAILDTARRVVQVRRPLYFWREHPGSQTNSGGANARAAQARRMRLEDRASAAATRSSGRFDVAPGHGCPPVDTAVMRVRAKAPAVTLRVIGGSQGRKLACAQAWNAAFPFRHLHLANGGESDCLRCADSVLELRVNAAHLPMPDSDVWQAVGLLERYPDLVAVGDVYRRNDAYLVGWEPSADSSQELFWDHCSADDFLQRQHFPTVSARLCAPTMLRVGSELNEAGHQILCGGLDARSS